MKTYHPAFLSNPALDILCKPLLKYTSFNSVVYERFGFNGLLVGAFSGGDNVVAFGSMVCSQGLLPSMDEVINHRSHYLPLSMDLLELDSNEESKFLTANIKMAKEYDIFHRLCLVFHHADYVEAFSFAISNRHKKVMSIFLNEAPFLERFCKHFREASEETIKSIPLKDAWRFDVPGEPNTVPSFESTLDKTYQAFLHDAKLQDHSVQGKNGKCSLSSREFECLTWSCRGKTAKEIAKILSLSPRTVETYLENLKIKLGCTSKYELIHIGVNNPVVKSYL